MTSKKKRKINFQGMSYIEVQKANSQSRNTLNTKNRKWLKENGYKNVGWQNVIQLYQKLNDFLPSLEELFLEADRIGNKYQTQQEIDVFNRKMSQEVEEIANIIDRQFPETEIEVIDFRLPGIKKPKKRHNFKNYRTVKR
jgi:hypothetical protein